MTISNEEFIYESTILLTEAEKKSLSFAQPTEEFRSQVIKIMETIEKESGTKVGAGPADAAFGNLKIKITNAIKRVKEGKLKNTYAIIIPYNTLKHMDKSLSGDEIVESVLKKDGFSKGGKLAYGGDYFYKKCDKALCVAGYYHASGQIQLQMICVEDTKENLKFIKSNHMNESGIFAECVLI